MPKGWAANHPDEAQMIAAGLGMIVGSISNDKKIGRYIAQMGAKWNLELNEHAKDKRQEAWKQQKELYIETYQEVKQSIDPLAYSPDDISNDETILKERYGQASQYGELPVATSLLGYYLDGDDHRHGITNIEYKDGLRIVEFGEASSINKALKNNENMNLCIIANTIRNAYRDGNITIPTYVDSYNFYSKGLDTTLGLGSATAIASIKITDSEVQAKITITDYYDFGRKEAVLGDFLKAAYELQQSGAKETFAYKTTYDVSYSIENLDDYMQGFGG